MQVLRFWCTINLVVKVMSPSQRLVPGAGGIFSGDWCTNCGLNEAFHEAFHESECQVFSRQGSQLSDDYGTRAPVSHARQVKGLSRYIEVGGASNARPRRPDTPQCAEIEGTSHDREQVSSGHNVGESSSAKAPISDHRTSGDKSDTAATSRCRVVCICADTRMRWSQPERQEWAILEARQQTGRRARSEEPETRQVIARRGGREEQERIAPETRGTHASNEREATQELQITQAGEEREWGEEHDRVSVETRATPESFEREVTEEGRTSQEWEGREGSEALQTTQEAEEREGTEELQTTQEWDETEGPEEPRIVQEREDGEVPVDRQVEWQRWQAIEGDDDGERVRDICEKCHERERCEICLLCAERRRDAVLIPCGHRVCCLICAGKLKPADCPVCRVEFELAHPIFDA